ncbi:MAG: hypothetical protein IPH75_11425 [bacterium]|nr:hypothetical protein [bacterium]
MTEATRQFEAACQQHAKDSTGNYLASTRILSTNRFKELLNEEPIQVIMVILRNIRDNMHNELSMVRLQIPTIDRFCESVRLFNVKERLNYRVTVLSLIGATLLCFRRQWRVCLSWQ